MPLRRICILFALAAALTLTACGQIEDTNGADISLATLTKEEILGETHSYASVGSLHTQIGEQYSFQVRRLSGVYDLETFTARGRVLEIRTDAALTEGNLRILLLCDGEYVTDIPLGEHTTAVENPDGRFEIRLAAESAKMQMTYTIEVTE